MSAAQMPVTIRGDSNSQLKGVAAVMRSMPQRVTPALAPLIAAPIPATRSFEDIVFVGAVPKARIRTEELAGGAVVTIKHTIKVDTYEVSLAVNADDYDDDQIGTYTGILEELAQSLLLAPDELITTNLVLKGDTVGKGYDAQFFYSNAHVFPGGKNVTAQNNKLAKTGVDGASIETDFYKVRNGMMNWLDDQNRVKMPPVDFAQDDSVIIHHPVALSQAMNQVFGLTKGGDSFELQPATDQTKFPRRSSLAGKAILVPDAYMDANGFTTGWFGHSVKGIGNSKPFGWLDRTPPYMVILGPGSEHYVKENEVLFIGRRRFGLGYLRPERSFRVA